MHITMMTNQYMRAEFIWKIWETYTTDFEFEFEFDKLIIERYRLDETKGFYSLRT